MIEERIVTAKTERQAKERVALELGVDAEKLNCEMIEAAKKGILGFGAQDPKFKVSYEDNTKPAKQTSSVFEPEVKEAAEKAEQKSVSTNEKGVDVVISFVDMILADMKLTASAKLVKSDKEDVYIEIVGENLGVIIGHHGEVLDSIQYLANIVCENEKADNRRIHIDVENYRARREETLNKLADRMAKKALASGRNVTLEPMNPYERRIIHSRIQNIEGVTTRSVGTDLGRKVVIYPEKGYARGDRYDDKYKVERPEYSASDGCYDRYTAPGK